MAARWVKGQKHRDNEENATAHIRSLQYPSPTLGEGLFLMYEFKTHLILPKYGKQKKNNKILSRNISLKLKTKQNTLQFCLMTVS